MIGVRVYNKCVDPADHKAEALFKNNVTRNPNNSISVFSKAPALTSMTSACSCRISVPGFRSGHFALLGAVMVTSKFQSDTRERLQLLLRGFEVKENYRPDWMKNPKTGKNLELDFFFPLVNIAVEVQGEQHLRYLPAFHKTPADFEKQQERDQIKRELCKERGIALYEVFKVDDIEELIYSMRGHCREMALELTKKVCALKTVEYYAAEIQRINGRREFPGRKEKLIRAILHICEKYSIPIESVKPNKELTKLDVCYAIKPKIQLIRDGYNGGIVTRRAALIRVENDVAEVVSLDNHGTDYRLRFSAITGEEIKTQDSLYDWRLDLSSLPTQAEIKAADDAELED